EDGLLCEVCGVRTIDGARNVTGHGVDRLDVPSISLGRAGIDDGECAVMEMLHDLACRRGRRRLSGDECRGMYARFLRRQQMSLCNPSVGPAVEHFRRG